MANDVEIIPLLAGLEQGGEAWRMLRLGIPTASNFGDVMAAGDGKVRGLYMRKLAGEVMTGIPAEEYRGKAMDRGVETEPMLRAQFSIDKGLALEQVAFMKRSMPFGMIGASPDSLIGDDAGVEFKSEAPHILIETLKAGRVPPQHMPQLQGNMLVRGASSWWLSIGYPGMPSFHRRVMRDNAYIARLTLALEVFQQELDEMVSWLRNYGRDL